MSNRLFVCVVFALTPAITGAQAPRAAPRPSASGVAIDRGIVTADAHEVRPPNLTELYDQWGTAMIRRDRGFFDRTLAAGFVYRQADRLVTRETMMIELITGTDTVTAVRTERMNAQVNGETAVVNGWLAVRGRGPAGPFDRRYQINDVWVARGGRWQLASSDSYELPAQKAP